MNDNTNINTIGNNIGITIAGINHSHGDRSKISKALLTTNGVSPLIIIQTINPIRARIYRRKYRLGTPKITTLSITPSSIAKLYPNSLSAPSALFAPSAYLFSSFAALLLSRFAALPPPTPIPKINVRHDGSALHYTLDAIGSGPASAVDLFAAELTPGCMKRYNQNKDHKICGPSSAVTTPVATLIFDVLLHQDAFPGQHPSLRVYDTANGGSVDINDPARDIDRLDVAESIEHLGSNAATFRASEIPHYTQILDHACHKMGWDPQKFRGYRCRAQYPVYASQLTMVFEPPTQP